MRIGNIGSAGWPVFGTGRPNYTQAQSPVVATSRAVRTTSATTAQDGAEPQQDGPGPSPARGPIASFRSNLATQGSVGQVAGTIALHAEVVAIYREQVRLGFAYGDKVEFVSRGADGRLRLAKLVGVHDGSGSYRFSVAYDGQIPGSVGRLAQASVGDTPPKDASI